MTSNLCDIYTDGSYCPERNLGGWAAHVRQSGQNKLLGGYVTYVTDNNAMEMIAVIKAMDYIESLFLKDTIIHLIVDSQYVIDTLLATPLTIPDTCQIIIRKVKAHSGPTKRSDNINYLVDRESRRHMRAARKIYDEATLDNPFREAP